MQCGGGNVGQPIPSAAPDEGIYILLKRRDANRDVALPMFLVNVHGLFRIQIYVLGVINSPK